MPKARKVRVSVTPHEILFPTSRIFVESEAPLDPESAQSGIVVRGLVGQVRLTKSNTRASWSPRGALPPGRHTLKVAELADASGRKLSAAHEVPFFVTDSKAKVPSTLRVESMARLRFRRLGTEPLALDKRPRGKFVEIMKATHRETGEQRELAFNQDGRRVNAQRRLAEVAKANLKEFGKLHPSLHRRLKRLKAEQKVEVAIWLRAKDKPQERLKRRKVQPSRPPREVVAQRKFMTRLAGQFAGRVKERYKARKVETDPLAPVVYARLQRSQIRELAKSDEVVGVFLHERGGIDDLDDSIAIANSDAVHSMGFKGANVKVAVWENGPDDTSDLSIIAFFDSTQSKKSEHARHTHAIVKNKEEGKPNGHAPSCRLYSANDKDLDALTWAVQQKGCTVVSQSFHRDSEPKSSNLSFDDIYKDWLVLHWPYPTILQAAGNYWSKDPDNINPPSDEYVNHKGYNSLAVGNHNDNADAMSGSSVFRNPSTAHNDRELPEICANGTFVDAVGLTKSGTSMAAPAAAGSAALLQNVNSTLKSWPEGCRAILLAGAKRNVQDDTWWLDVVANVDASDGTGALDAYESVLIAQSRRFKNTAGVRRGWDVGTLRSSDFDSQGLSEFTYKVTVPSGPLFLGPRRVKVALAWNSKVDTLEIPAIDFEWPLSSNLTLDLDLKVFDSDGNLVAYSGSWDNSYEVAEFQGQRGETYTIRIRRWSGTDTTWYGIAWTVTGGLLIAREVLKRAVFLARDLP